MLLCITFVKPGAITVAALSPIKNINIYMAPEISPKGTELRPALDL